MSSTFSTNLALELIGTGDQAGTWGNTTNTNLGTLIEQAISGYVTQAMTTGNTTSITIPDGASGVARNMYLELTGTGGTNTVLAVPSNKKLYFVFNNTTGAVTVKVGAGTGVSVGAAEKKILVSNGTDIVEATSYLTAVGNSLNLTTLTATSANITTLTGTSANITTFTATSSNITTLTGTSANITTFTATSSNITTLSGTSANITTINGTSANITTVTGTTGGFTSANITTLSSTSANVTTLTGTSATITTILDGIGNVRNIPSAGAAKTSNYTLAITDIGEYVTIGTSGSITVPNDIFAAGNAVSIFNNTTGNAIMSLTITTAYIAGTDSDKASVTLATRGIATVLFVNPSLCVLTGNLS